MTDYLSAGFEIKRVDMGQRIISGHAAYFENEDKVGDVIDPTAFTKTLTEKRPADVLVTIGHKMDELPVGVPLTIRADANGLYTETKVLNTRAGDDLLQTARELLAHGQALGMSIGYRTRDSRPDRSTSGKTIRRLTDIDLLEYCFAPSQSIANPKALVVGVKQGGAMRYSIEKRGDHFAVIDSEDGDVESTHPTRAAAEARMRALMSGAAAGDTEGGKMDESRREDKAVWDTAYVNNLPDSAFLYVEDGTKDDEGKTVPRSKRHFPYKDSGGSVDLPHLRNAVARIPQSNAPGLNKDALQARARRLLDQANSGGKMDDEASQWKLGPDQRAPAALQIRAFSYSLLDIGDQVADEHKAMLLLGEETKAGAKIRQAWRAKLRELAAGIIDMVDQAERVDTGTEGAAKIRGYRAELERLRL